MHSIITESDIELAALEILEGLGYEVLHGPNIAPAPDGKHPERQSYSDVVLLDRLKSAIDRINPKIPADAKEEALKIVLRLFSQNLAENNRQFHNMLVNGVDVEYRLDDRIIGDKIWLFDFKDIENNEFLVVNQFTVIEDNNNEAQTDTLTFGKYPL